MAGRPPKPTALKLLQGNPGKRKLNMDEPKPPPGAEPPGYIKLNLEALAEWKVISAKLLRLGLLTEVDDNALATLCVLEVKFRSAVVNDAAGSTLAEISREKRALWSRFGMTPADRVRVKVEKPQPESKLERFIGGKKA